MQLLAVFSLKEGCCDDDDDGGWVVPAAVVAIQFL